MVFAEAEANAVTDEIAARSSLREREREPQEIGLLERDEEPVPLKTVIPTAPANEEEDVQFEISLSPETGKGGEEEEKESIVELGKEVTPTSDIVVDQPKEELEEPVASVKPATSTEVKLDEDLQTQPIPTETTTNDSSADVNVSIPETVSISKKPETAIPVATKPDEKEPIPLSIVKDVDELPTVVPDVSVEEDEVPADKQPEVSVDADKHSVVSSPAAGNETTEEDKVVAADSTSAEVGEVVTGEEQT